MSGKRAVAWSASRGQASVRKVETQCTDSNKRTFDEFKATREVDVSLFDNLKLAKSGEYLIRGVVNNFPCVEGVFEPKHCSSIHSAYGACVAATGIVRLDERNLIPIRVVTLEDNVHLKKGFTIGTLRVLECDESMNLRGISLEKDKRWELLEPKFTNKLTSMPISQQKELLPLLKEFSDIFSISKSDIGLTGMVTHEIDTGDEKPICTPYRRIPLALEEKVDDMVKELQTKGIIRPSLSPWNAPLVVVPKKNGDIRLTVDYRKLNSITARPVFPMPDSRALLDTLSGSAYFTTLDLSSGYYNIPMKEEDIQKTAFSTRHNHWEFVRMPMGLSTAPGTFQRLMHMVFHKENWKQCLIYLDDVLLFSDSIHEHMIRMRVIFERIREAGLKLSPEKCTFLQRKVCYLGYEISEKGTHTDPSKIEKIQSWPIPKTVDELRSFIGLCGYYRQHIDKYAHIVAPLENMCKPLWNKKSNRVKIPIEFNNDQKRAFESLKQALTTAPVLAFPTMDGEFILDTDASHDAIGSVLSQIQNGKETVIAYASKKLSQAERQYCITRKELLAVYFFVTHYKHYLLGRKFVVRTDHRALCWMLNWKQPNTSQYCRWKQELEIYDMKVEYRPGEKHVNADALSRLPSCEQCELRHMEPKRKRNIKILNKDKNDAICCRRIVAFENDLDQENDPTLKLIIELLKAGKLAEKEPPSVRSGNEEIKRLWNKRENLRIRGDMLYMLSKDGKYRLIIPAAARNNVIKMAHETLAHIGIKKMCNLFKQNYYWLNMDLDIKLYIASCKYCTERKSSPIKKHSPDSLSSGYPFEKVSIDITGPLPAASRGERYILGIIDNFSKFPALIPLKTATAENVARALYKNWISVYGVPSVIHSDRGTEFENELILDMCKLLGIRKSRSSPYYPQGDGIIERLFRTAKDMIYATCKSRQKDWVDILPSVEMGLRCTQTKKYKLTPYEIIFGREMVTPLNVDDWSKKYDKHVQSEYVTGIRKAMVEMHEKIRQINGRDNRNEDAEQNFTIGQRVYIKVFPVRKGINQPRYIGPFEVVQIKGRWCYVLKDCKTGKIVERNYYHIKRYTGKGCSTDEQSGRPNTSIWSATVKKRDEGGQHGQHEVNHVPRPTRRRRQPIRYGIDMD